MQCANFSAQHPRLLSHFLSIQLISWIIRCFFLSFQSGESEQSLGRLEFVWWSVEKTWVGVVVPLAQVEELSLGPPPGVYTGGPAAGGAAAAQPRVRLVTKCSRVRGFNVSNGFKWMIISF